MPKPRKENPKSTPRKRVPTKKQQIFIEEYTKTGNGTQSAMKAYDTTDNKIAANIAVENLGKPYIAEEIDKRLQDAKNMIYVLATTSEKDEIKLRASQDIVDRIEGKAVQRVLSAGNLKVVSDDMSEEELLSLVKQGLQKI